jgi:hypothetical protein
MILDANIQSISNILQNPDFWVKLVNLSEMLTIMPFFAADLRIFLLSVNFSEWTPILKNNS